jgi:hypothetical protein
VTQSVRGSLAETLFNTTVGFAINFTANLLILPLFGFPISAGPAFHMGLWFTAISILRGFGVRRLFNNHTFAAAIDRGNDYLGVPLEWLKSRLASATSRARSVDRKTTSGDTMTVTASALGADTTRPDLKDLLENNDRALDRTIVRLLSSAKHKHSPPDV